MFFCSGLFCFGFIFMGVFDAFCFLSFFFFFIFFFFLFYMFRLFVCWFRISSGFVLFVFSPIPFEFHSKCVCARVYVSLRIRFWMRLCMCVCVCACVCVRARAYTRSTRHWTRKMHATILQSAHETRWCPNERRGMWSFFSLSSTSCFPPHIPHTRFSF